METLKHIWLAPACHENDPEGRSWCDHDAWGGACDECGGKPVRYTRADIAQEAAMQALADGGQAQEALERLRAVESERDALQAAVRSASEDFAHLADHILAHKGNHGAINWRGMFADLQRSGMEMRAALTATPAPVADDDGLAYQRQNWPAPRQDTDKRHKLLGYMDAKRKPPPAPGGDALLIEYAERVERLVGLTESERARFGAVLRGWAGQDVAMPEPGDDVGRAGVSTIKAALFDPSVSQADFRRILKEEVEKMKKAATLAALEGRANG